MTAAPRVTLRHRVEYVSLRAFAGAVGVLGYRLGSLLARLAAPVYCLADRRHWRVAASNIETRLGLPRREARRMASASFRHLFQSAVEILRLDRELERRSFDDVVRVENLAVMEEALARGKGVVLCTGHLGNWEAVARLCKIRGWRIATIYRPLDNPLLDRWVDAFRRAHGQEMAPKHGALRHLLRALRKGDVGALLVDQDARRRGVMVPFLGVPASTIPTPAELALRTGAAIITVFTWRTGPGFRHVVRFDPPLDATPTGDRDADVLRIMTEINRRLEAALRNAPEQWLWAHRRWKSSGGAAASVPASPREANA